MLQALRQSADTPLMVGPFHIDWGELLIAFLLVKFVTVPLVTLGHEFGHAALALRATPGPVTVVVGRRSTAIGLCFERLDVWFSPVPTGKVFGGGCFFDAASVTPRERLRIALAGPLVDALLIPVWVAAAILASGAPAWLQATFVLTAFGCLLGCVFDLDPRPATAEERRSMESSHRDGPNAILAYRQAREEAKVQ